MLGVPQVWEKKTKKQPSNLIYGFQSSLLCFKAAEYVFQWCSLPSTLGKQAGVSRDNDEFGVGIVCWGSPRSQREAEFSLGHETGNLVFSRHAGVAPTASFSECLGLTKLLPECFEGYLSQHNVKIQCDYAQLINFAFSEWVFLVFIYIEQVLYSCHSTCPASMDSWRALTLLWSRLPEIQSQKYENCLSQKHKL